MDQLRSLRIFTQVIAAGSFAGAARALDLAPAVVTRAVADLEQHLGARLLNRTSRRLALTEIGEAYLLRAQQLLVDLADADALASAQTLRPEGPLRIVCPPAFAAHQLARQLPRFHVLYPQITLEIATPGPVEAADEHFDVSILSIGEQPLQGDFIARQLASSAFIICASPAYLAQHGTPQTPQQLLEHQALLPAVSAVRRELTLYGPAGQKINLPLIPALLSSSQIELLLAACLAGLGIAGLPSFIAEQALNNGALVRVLPEWQGTTLNLYAAMPTRKHIPARTRVFVDFLVQTFGGSSTDPWLKAPQR